MYSMNFKADTDLLHIVCHRCVWIQWYDTVCLCISQFRYAIVQHSVLHWTT